MDDGNSRSGGSRRCCRSRRGGRRDCGRKRRHIERGIRFCAPASLQGLPWPRCLRGACCIPRLARGLSLAHLHIHPRLLQAAKALLAHGSEGRLRAGRHGLGPVIAEHRNRPPPCTAKALTGWDRWAQGGRVRRWRRSSAALGRGRVGHGSAGWRPPDGCPRACGARAVSAVVSASSGRRKGRPMVGRPGLGCKPRRFRT